MRGVATWRHHEISTFEITHIICDLTTSELRVLLVEMLDAIMKTAWMPTTHNNDTIIASKLQHLFNHLPSDTWRENTKSVHDDWNNAFCLPELTGHLLHQQVIQVHCVAFEEIRWISHGRVQLFCFTDEHRVDVHSDTVFRFINKEASKLSGATTHLNIWHFFIALRQQINKIRLFTWIQILHYFTFSSIHGISPKERKQLIFPHCVWDVTFLMRFCWLASTDKDADAFNLTLDINTFVFVEVFHDFGFWPPMRGVATWRHHEISTFEITHIICDHATSESNILFVKILNTNTKTSRTPATHNNNTIIASKLQHFFNRFFSVIHRQKT